MEKKNVNAAPRPAASRPARRPALPAATALFASCAACAAADATPLPEHPGPDRERAGRVNLDGRRDFGFEKDAYDRKIAVPSGTVPGPPGLLPPEAATPKPSASKWPEGTAEVMGGLKINGFGRGWFEYEVAAPAQCGVFRAELSAKRRNWKNRKEPGRETDYVTGKRTTERSKNPNSYPQTSADKFPAKLTVRVGGKIALERMLPDDPADHRGLLSWLAQPHDGMLREAGSYGWLVEVKVPPEAVKDGKATIRLESDAGLAVYGPRFGHYPLGPGIGD